jgi:hypothetical protein
VPGRLWLSGYLTPSDSDAAERLERTEANPGEEISLYYDHRLEAGRLYWYQSSNYGRRQGDQTVVITRLTTRRVVRVAHGDSVSRKVSLGRAFKCQLIYFRDGATYKEFPRVDTTLAQLCEFGEAVLYHNGRA